MMRQTYFTILRNTLQRSLKLIDFKKQPYKTEKVNTFREKSRSVKREDHNRIRKYTENY